MVKSWKIQQLTPWLRSPDLHPKEAFRQGQGTHLSDLSSSEGLDRGSTMDSLERSLVSCICIYLFLFIYIYIII